MKIYHLAILSFAALWATSCSDGEPDDIIREEIKLTRSEENALKAVNRFAFDVFKTANEVIGSNHPNYAFSPQTYAWNIAMIANGTTEGSEAENELITALHLGDDADISDVNDYSSKLIEAIRNSGQFSSCSASNAVFYNDNIGIKSSYLDILKSFYGIREFKNHSNAAIDSWISSETGGIITDFAKLNNLEERNFGVISNLYFEGLWREPFDIKDTKDLDFRNADGSVSKVPMMSKTDMYTEIGESEFSHLLSIKFKGWRYCINFLIPKEGKSLEEVIEKLDNDTWEEMLKHNHSYPFTSVRIPRFEIRSNIDFLTISRKLGISEIFENSYSMQKAFESEMVMTAASQSTYIKIDESGAKAVSTSQISGDPTSVAPGCFYLDEAFIYMITEYSSGAILFMGKTSQL